jgi:NitT/TauT family transport system substrate-binding protein
MSRLRLLVLLSLILSACGGAAAGQPASSAPPTAHLTFSYSNVVPDNLPLWIAKDAGIFDRHRLDVDLQLITSVQGMPALLSGQTQFADIGGSEALSAAAGGGEVVVLANLTPVSPYLFYAAPGISDASQLKGRKVATTNPGGSADIANQIALKKLNLDPGKDVTVVNLGSVANITTGLLNGSVQASVSHPPESAELEARGFHPLLDLAKQKLPFASVTVVARRSYVAANRSIVQRLIDSIVEAIGREKKDRALGIGVLKKYYKSSDDRLMAAAYDYYAQEVVQQPPYCRSNQFTDAQAVLGARNDKVKSFDLDKLFDNSFVKSSADRGLGRA